MMEYEYKVIDVAYGAISSVLLGERRIETCVLEAYINADPGDREAHGIVAQQLSLYQQVPKLPKFLSRQRGWLR